MIFFTTLKQKDLSAVSAQQLFDNYFQGSDRPSHIQRFDQYEIISDISDDSLLQMLNETYIFSNPNKHHLITNSSFFNNSSTYVNVSRKLPLNLNSKVSSLKKIFQNNTIEAVYQSELWAFTTKNNISDDEILSTFIHSSKNNVAPFAHPVIHNASVIDHARLIKQLNYSATVQ